MLSGSLLFSRAALFCFPAGEAVEQELQYILWQSLRGGSVEFGETGLSHEAVHLADEEVDEFGWQAVVDEFALLQGVEKAAHKLIFLFFHAAEEAFQFQIGHVGDVVEYGRGLEFGHGFALDGE